MKTVSKIIGIRVVATQAQIAQIKAFIEHLDQPEIIVRNWERIDAQREMESIIKECFGEQQ
jgi:hypothetical protein